MGHEPPSHGERASAPATLLLLAALTGCYRHMEPDFASPEPGARNQAIVQAAARGDRDSVREMVPLLESDDSATRLLAIRTLERLTGETFGYDYTKARVQNVASVSRWREYAGPRAAEIPGRRAGPGK